MLSIGEGRVQHGAKLWLQAYKILRYLVARLVAVMLHPNRDHPYLPLPLITRRNLWYSFRYRGAWYDHFVAEAGTYILCAVSRLPKPFISLPLPDVTPLSYR